MQMLRPRSMAARLLMMCLLAPLQLPLCILTELGATNTTPVVRVAKGYAIAVMRVVTYLDSVVCPEPVRRPTASAAAAAIT